MRIDTIAFALVILTSIGLYSVALYAMIHHIQAAPVSHASPQ